jgi:hypothetical protein
MSKRSWVSVRRNRNFCNAYACAREAQADALAERALQVAQEAEDDYYTDARGQRRFNKENVLRSRLKYDALVWLAGKVCPRKYSDRQAFQVNQINGGGQNVSNGDISQNQGAELNVISAEDLADLQERRRKTIERIRQGNAMEVAVK